MFSKWALRCLVSVKLRSAGAQTVCPELALASSCFGGKKIWWGWADLWLLCMFSETKKLIEDEYMLSTPGCAGAAGVRW